MPRRYKRTIDLLQLTALLQTHVGGMSMNEIAERFDLSRRTAERMMAALRENFPHLESKIRDGRKYWHFARSGDGGSLRVPPEFSSFAQPLTDPALSALRDALMRLFEVTQKTLDSVNHREASLGPLASFVSRINRNVEATLRFMQQEPPDFEAVFGSGVVQSVRDEIAETARRQGVEVEAKTDVAVPTFLANRENLAAALVNLAKNALEAMPTGGRLELQLEFAEMMGEVRFRISDSGPGIPLADRERVLEPFVSTKPGHAGLGLTAARDVARAHGGRLEIATRPHGPGFTVAIAIPLTQRR